MKKLYLVHCWSGTINDGWYPWLKEKLAEHDIDFIAHNMPNTDTPKINEWVSYLDEIVENLDDETYFIGHSIGCQTIMRFLERKDVTKIAGILFVAPWLNLLPDEMDEESNEIAHEWINTPINFEKIKQFTNNVTCIFSDDDYFVPLDNQEKFKEMLDAKTIVVKNKGHISADDDIYEADFILDEITSMMNKNH